MRMLTCTMLTRTMLICTMLAGAILLTAMPARAQTYDPRFPVCMQVFGPRDGGDYFDCSFMSVPQCQATASGRAAMCLINPFYVPVTNPPARVKHRRSRRAY